MNEPASNQEHELLTHVSHARHELRTPVSAMLGYCQRLLEDADSLPYPHFQSGLQEVHLVSRRLYAAIDELLQPTHLENPAHDLPALASLARRELRPYGEQILRVGQRLLGQAQTVPLSAFLTDLDRILSAAHRFLSLLGETLAFGAAGPAAGFPLRPTDEALLPAEQESAILAESADILQECVGHVLIVDDSPFNRDILARTMLAQRRHFALAGDGKQALEVLASRSFDLVFLDILMPEMDGFEVLTRLKQNPELAQTPVIVISAPDQIDNVVRCLEMGAVDYLPKPFDPVLLKTKVESCLELKRLRELEKGMIRLSEEARTQARGEIGNSVIAELAARDDALGKLARCLQPGLVQAK